MFSINFINVLSNYRCIRYLVFPAFFLSISMVFIDYTCTSFVDPLCFCSVLCLLCLCVRLFICALRSPAGKGLTSWLLLVVSAVSLSRSHWYPGSGVVLDCIDS